jgi:hypothetical protein
VVLGRLRQEEGSGVQADCSQVGGRVEDEREVLKVLLGHTDEKERELWEAVQVRWVEGKVRAEVADEVLMEVERGHQFELEVEGK